MNTNPSIKYILPKGFGYWDVTIYPKGGDFHRTAEDIAVEIIKEDGIEARIKLPNNRVGITQRSILKTK